ncbi:hypothetical protein EON66_11340 [archaeon]|nr:MAG: hypothetical protein EON66_11340 [archaeon]
MCGRSPRVVQLPVYALIVFGCYAMATIGSALLSYNDCTAAAAELKGDITRVKAALEKKGYKAPPMPAAKQ